MHIKLAVNGALLLGILLAVTRAGAAETVAAETIVAHNGVLTLIDFPTVSAGQAGRLLSCAREGDLVIEGGLVAQIDDSRAQDQLALAAKEYTVAKRQAESDVSIRFNKAAAKVAEAEYEEAIEANLQSEKTFSDAEVRRRGFESQRSVLAIENADEERIIGIKTAQVRYQAWLNAGSEIKRFKVLSPAAGFVSESYRQVGEWVSPGDPIVKIVRMDKLRVEARVYNSHWTPNDLLGKRVRVKVHLRGVMPHTERMTIGAIDDGLAVNDLFASAKPEDIRYADAVIGYASREIDMSNQYRIWAEFDNPTDSQGRFLFSAGLSAQVIVADDDGLQIGDRR